MRRLHELLCLVAAGFTINVAQALPDDSQQKMHIVAQSSLINYKSGFNSYEGNVKMHQGETHLTADRVTTQSNNQHKMEEAIAYGTSGLAHYWTLPQKGDKLFHARASVIKYYPQKGLIVLQGKVLVTQGDNSFRGPEIIYNIKEQTVLSPATQKGRSTIIIEPTKSDA